MRRRAVFLISLILFNLFPPLEFRRGGGGGLGGSRGSSGSRASSGGFGSRGNTGSRTSGGIFGGGTKTGLGRNEYSRGTNLGQNSRPSSNTGGGWNSHGTSSGGGWNKGSSSSNAGSKGGFLGGLFGRKHGTSSHQAGYGSRSGGWSGSRWTNSGMGSRSRGNTFKNMIVGAAAGYLTYQAGKAIIRAAAGPMMWNNRPYYWGSNYYRSSPGHTNMCRMPIDSSDPQFGNIFFQDQSRPREITWGCGYYEHCCGYECCRGGGSVGSDRIGGRGTSMGLLLIIALLLCCGVPLVMRYIRRN